MRSSASPGAQRGVALVTAILLVAIATAIAAKLAWDNQISLRRTEATVTQEQARAIAIAGDAIVAELISRIDDTPEVDREADGYFGQEVPFLIEMDELVLGELVGVITDAQRKLNINNLVEAGNGGPDPVAQDQFVRLFTSLNLDPGLVDEIIDWIDADSVPTGSGAEDGAYTGMRPPYRAANNYLLDASELLAILNLDPVVWYGAPGTSSKPAVEGLRNHVTAIPPGWCGTGGASGTLVVPVNVNFASEYVIAALSPSITLAEAANIVAVRDGGGSLQDTSGKPNPEGGFESWADYQWPEDFQSLQGTYATLYTNCFGVFAQAVIGSVPLTMYSLLDRSSGSGAFVTRVRQFGLDYVDFLE